MRLKKFDFFKFLSGYYMGSKISEPITTEYTTCRQIRKNIHFIYSLIAIWTAFFA